MGRWLLLLMGLTLSLGCAIDFDEAIPCSGEGQCPSDYACDLNFRRCVPAEAISDVGGIEEDVTPTRDTGVDDTSADVDLDVTDADTDLDSGDAGDVSDVELDVADVGDVDAGDADDDTEVALDAGDTGDATDVAPDVPMDTGCTPSPEVCDGLDNDCNGTPDDGIDCGGPCGLNAVLVDTGAVRVCMDLYEASRQDATAGSAGTDDSVATTRPGVLPWAFATYAQADSACLAAGKRLCTAVEWEAGCAGADTWSYPYDRRLYDGAACNGLNTPPLDSAVGCGTLASCLSQPGVFDMSGNLAEWASDSALHGGAYDDVSTNLRCTSVDRTVNPTVSQPSAGFRCCANAP